MTRLLLSLLALLCNISSISQSQQCLQNIQFNGAKGAIIICNDEALKIPRAKPVEVRVACNSNRPLPVIITKDSITRHLQIMPINARGKWHYPENIYININDTGNVYYFTKPMPDKRFTLNLSILGFNQFYFNMGNRDTVNVGIPGASLGVNYYYKKNRFWSVQAGAASDFLTTNIGEQFGDTIYRRLMSALFVNVKHNHVVGYFDFGYGLAYSHHHYNETQMIRQANSSKQNRDIYNNGALAASLSGYVHIGRVLAVGLLYQPQFLSFQNNVHFKYEHNINLDIAFRIPFKRSILFN